MRAAALPSLLFLLCVGLAFPAHAQTPRDAGLEQALERAGEHRGELERALEAAAPEELEALRYLLRHMPERDLRSLAADYLLGEVRLALAARAQVPWGGALAEELFLGYVLPYAQADEPREGWRGSFAERFLPLVAECKTPGEAAQKLNQTIFNELAVHYSTSRKRALQAPSESIAQGKATCTGLSILLADACRACCVPARLISVRWPHKQGNHTWVEVWDGERWRFCGADEPDPAGLDRAWFVGDAAQCAAADPEHRLWAVSFAATGTTFQPGWESEGGLHGVDVSARYAPTTGATASGDEAVLQQMARFFASAPAARATFEFDRNLDAELGTAAGDARLRRLAFQAFREAPHEELHADFAENRVTFGSLTSPYVLRMVGDSPAGGWPLVIAMHGGGGAPKEVNDQQWRVMQAYYKDHPEASGYLYCALRAPNDEWNGFYYDGFYPLLERLIRQLVVCAEVDPERVYAIGYSHGGYGAFALGPKLPHRFAAVHASAAAPTDGESLATGLHGLAFSFMVGGKDDAYGRRERCLAFEQSLAGLRAEHPALYPTKFTLVEGNGHTGLPDRDILPELLSHVRNATPNELYWEPSDGVVRDHYWLHVAAPAKGQRFEARIDARSLRLRRPAGTACELWLDARLCDLARPLQLDLADDAPLRELTPAPSLRVLCTTLEERGDPGLAASWIVPVGE